MKIISKKHCWICTVTVENLWIKKYFCQVLSLTQTTGNVPSCSKQNLRTKSKNAVEHVSKVYPWFIVSLLHLVSSSSLAAWFHWHIFTGSFQRSDFLSSQGVTVWTQTEPLVQSEQNQMNSPEKRKHRWEFGDEWKVTWRSWSGNKTRDDDDSFRQKVFWSPEFFFLLLTFYIKTK